MNKLLKIPAIAGLASFVLMSSTSALASGDVAVNKQIHDIQVQLMTLQQQVENQQKIIETQQSIIDAQSGTIKDNSSVIEEHASLLTDEAIASQLAAITPAGGGESGGDGFKITFNPSPKISSTDGAFSFQPFGRIHLDYTFFNDDVQDNADNVNFRRARLGFKGTVAHDWAYKFEVDFAGEATNFKETYIAYKGLDNAEIRAGHFKPFLGMDENTSSNYIQFVERAAANSAFARDEVLGVAVLTGGDNWSLAGGVFNDDAGQTAAADDEAWSVDVRGTFVPVNESGRVVHLGTALSYRVPDAGSDSDSFSVRPEVGTGSRFLNTGTIAGVDSTTIYSVELAGVYDSLAVQSEYYNANVDLAAGGNDPSFDGWYAQASYLLTGESRPYSAKTGHFGRIKPNTPFTRDGGSGAWEILTRYSNTDLNDNGAGVLGGELDNLTIGLNWYINNNVRMMANYINIETDSNAAVANSDADAFLVRAQIDF